MSDIMDVTPGSKVYTSLKGMDLADGSELRFPVVIIKGAHEGKKLFVGAATHGNEYPPIAVVGALTQRIDPEKLHGTFVGVPIMNPLGFRAKVIDPPTSHRKNMYGAFPGKPDGDSAQMMAHALFTNLISKTDYVVDLHTARDTGDFVTQTYFAPLDMGDAAVKGKELAEIFGAEQYNDEYDGHDGYLHVVLAKQGIPGIVAEVPRDLQEAISAGVRGVNNIMIHLGMLDGNLEGTRSKILIKGPPHRPEVRATKGGILVYVAKLGQSLNKGDPIAKIIDVFGREVEIVKSPVDGLMQLVSIQQVIEPGERVARIGVPV